MRNINQELKTKREEKALGIQLVIFAVVMVLTVAAASTSMNARETFIGIIGFVLGVATVLFGVPAGWIYRTPAKNNDIGKFINAAYNALPLAGGRIVPFNDATLIFSDGREVPVKAPISQNRDGQLCDANGKCYYP